MSAVSGRQRWGPRGAVRGSPEVGAVKPTAQVMGELSFTRTKIKHFSYGQQKEFTWVYKEPHGRRSSRSSRSQQPLVLRPWACKEGSDISPLPPSYRQLTGQLIAPGGSQAERTWGTDSKPPLSQGTNHTPAPPEARQPLRTAKKHPRAITKHSRKIPSSNT